MEHQDGNLQRARLRYSVSSESIRSGVWDQQTVAYEYEQDRRLSVSDMTSRHYKPLLNPLVASEAANVEPQQFSVEDGSRQVHNAVGAKEDEIRSEEAYKTIPTTEKTAGTTTQDYLAVVGFARMPPLPDPEPQNIQNASIEWLNSERLPNVASPSAQKTENMTVVCSLNRTDFLTDLTSLVHDYVVTDAPLLRSGSKYWGGSRGFHRSSVNLTDGTFEPFDNETAITDYCDFLSNMLNFTLRYVPTGAYFGGTLAFSACQAFNYSDSRTDTMSTMATSVAKTVRQSRNATAINGKVFEVQNFIEVHWPWSSRPVALVVLAGGLLDTNTWTSEDKQAPRIWKSSLVPLLFRGLESWERDELRGERKTELESLAATMQTQLRKDDSGNTQYFRID